jgi:hypothetical protein
LFAEDLKQGRLVSTSLEKTFENLKTSPPDFDSDDVLVAAAETPRMEMETRQEVLANRAPLHDLAREVEMNGAPETYVSPPDVAANGTHNVKGPAGQELEVEMDVS